MIFAFGFAISYSVESKIVHIFLFGTAGYLFFTSSKKARGKLRKILSRINVEPGVTSSSIPKATLIWHYTRYHFLRRLRSVSLFASSSPTKTSFFGSHVSSRRSS